MVSALRYLDVSGILQYVKTVLWSRKPDETPSTPGPYSALISHSGISSTDWNQSLFPTPRNYTLNPDEVWYEV